MIARRKRLCPDDGALRLLIEPDAAGDALVHEHVRSCPDCGARLIALRDDADDTALAIQLLERPADSPDVSQAYARFRAQLAVEGDGQWEGQGGRMADLWSRRPVRAVTAAVAAVALMLALSISPMRTVAEDFLNQFRVQKFAAVTIPMNLIEPIKTSMLDNMTEEDRQALEEQFERLGTFETTFDFDLENPPPPVTLEEAEAQYGEFDVPDDLPDGYNTAPNAYVTEDGSASYTLNVAEAQRLIDELNLPIYTLPDPADYPTLEFRADIPAAVVLEYVNAADERVVVGQMESPTLSIPDGIDMDEVREDILRFPGLPADLVAQLRSIEDWENTLIVPVPEDASTDNITVNGSAGLLIESAEWSAVLWEKDGILYAVAGEVDGDAVRDVADSMQ